MEVFVVSDQKYWMINDFSKMLGNHVSTINGYIKNLEDSGIHYVERIHGKRVYDELDFEVANYIVKKRKDGWSIDGIMNSLRDENPPVELRPFPPDHQGTTELSLNTVTEIQNVLKREFDSRFLNQSEEIEAYLEDQMKKLEEKMNAERIRERQQKITDLITTNRIQIELEIEALAEWEKKPVSERFVKVGLFKKVEDTGKKDIFIKSYIRDHQEKRLLSSFETNTNNLLE